MDGNLPGDRLPDAGDSPAVVMSDVRHDGQWSLITGGVVRVCEPDQPWAPPIPGAPYCTSCATHAGANKIRIGGPF